MMTSTGFGNEVEEEEFAFDDMILGVQSPDTLRDESESQFDIMRTPESLPPQDDIEDEEYTVLPGDAIPELSPSADKVDALIAKQMTQLSMQDREKVYYDLHGISGEIKETPEMIANSLIDLEEEIQKQTGKEAYETARSMNPEYVQDEKFLLQFLRADLFDAKKTALRLVRHFQTKLDLFGRDKLARNIIQDDLDEGSMEALYGGLTQTMPFRDRAGRIITVWFLSNDKFYHLSVEAKLRRLFYASMVLAEDEETQKKGLVSVIFIMCGNSKSKRFHNESTFKISSVGAKAIPLRIEAMHFCQDSLLTLAVTSIVKITFGLFNRLRVRTHYGSFDECTFTLQTFGIPANLFPVTPDGEVTTEMNTNMWEKRRKLERMTQKVDCVYVPSRNDVLFGRGKGLQQHLGNIRYRNLIENVTVTYDSASASEKKEITAGIVKAIKMSSGRFLKDDGAGWVEVDDDVARFKASHAFRSKRRAKVKTDGKTDFSSVSTCTAESKDMKAPGSISIERDMERSFVGDALPISKKKRSG